MGHSTEAGDDAITAINITPLVDVVLVLLVVLMVTASYVVRRSLPIEVPSASTHAPTTPRTLRVEIDAEGRRTVEGVVVDDDAALVARARGYVREAGADTHASVVADRRVEHGEVVHVLDVLRAEGVAHVGIAVRPTR